MIRSSLSHASSQLLSQHLVIPGQVIAVDEETTPSSTVGGGELGRGIDTDFDGSNDSGADGVSGFLRGHGTYLETTTENGLQQHVLMASVAGIVQRVNKLIHVEAIAPQPYVGHVGDLVVGRIVSVGNNRWNVSLSPSSSLGQSIRVSLPLSGVHLPGGIQRVRTSQDAREMRQFLAPGDLVCAEVHKMLTTDGTFTLHMRSLERYGKLENGVVLSVPPALIPRRKNHAVIILDESQEGVQLLLGCNGMIWLQRKLSAESSHTGLIGGPELAELMEKKRNEHRDRPYDIDDRRKLARVRNSIECLRLVHAMITPESIQTVFTISLEQRLSVPNMLVSSNVLLLTETVRNSQN